VKSPAKKARKTALPAFVPPQLATLVDAVSQGEPWLYEIKFDGYRMLCRVTNRQVAFLTREGHDWTRQFSFLIEPVTALPVREALFDGEIVALREDGSSDFQLLQNSLKGDRQATIVYFVFDLLYLDGDNLMNTPLLSRKETLAKLFKPNHDSLIRYSEHWFDGNQLYEEACRRSLEGIISKRSDLPYRSGRSRDWLKVKCLMSQEFVICGYTDPARSRKGLGALLLGVYDDAGELRYAGRVGTGFTIQTLNELESRLSKICQTATPLNEPLTGASAKGVHWVKPQLVAQVAFTGWTADGLLRHPSFQGLREDKPAKQIRRESVLPTAKVPRPGASSTATVRSSAHNDQVGGVTLTHPDRVLYPEQGITKRELAEYYEKIADWILPHVSGRPLTLVRCPEGHRKQCFYQRNVEDDVPTGIRRIHIRARKTMKNCPIIDSLAGLIALVQMGVLEIHTWGAREENIERPDRLTFDLDPDPSLPWKSLHGAASEVSDRLSVLGLSGFVKTTGGKGLHVVIPITPKHNWNQVKTFAKAFAESMAHDSPDLYVATMSKSKRKGKIFLDYLRNSRTATAVCAFSTRARAGAPVSVPLGWNELTADLRSDHFNLRNVPERLASLRKDPWYDFEAARRPLPEAV